MVAKDNLWQARDYRKLDRTGDLDIDRRIRRRTIPRQPVAKQLPEERIRNFNEVYLGYDEDTAMVEAARCLQCPSPQPCTLGCPLHNDIPLAMWLVSQGDFIGAANVYRQTSNLPEICGRVCPQEVLCQGSCVQGKNDLPVYLGKIEAFVTDYQRRVEGGIPLPQVEPDTGFRVAVVGSGPAGLACAEELRKRGHSITVYEAWPKPGGLLYYGIPAFKLPKHVVQAKIEQLQRMGIRFITGTYIGKDLTIDDLMGDLGFDAVFLGTGTGICARMNVPGEDLKGIYHSTDFLVRGNLPPDDLPEDQREPIVVGRRVAVIGGGDTAMDCVRTAIRLQVQRFGEPGEVVCVYRRTEAQMPGRAEERVNAREEGVRFEYLMAPVRFIGDEDGHVKAMEVVRMRLGEPDRSGRPRPEPIEGSEFVMDVDTVVLAIGYWPDPTLGETTPGLETRKWGLIVADPETGATSREGVFAGGDNVTGPDLVVTAMAAGRKAAKSIDAYLRGKRPESADFVPAMAGVQA
jgi:glutamate synthase (NADPH/NADH) small chain